jgi:gliding-associated putative ABC transporter substrate-binding component GldG
MAFKAIVIVKPTQPFSERQKLKLDQYVMNGGRLIWMIDKLYASLDSLQRSEGSFIAFDMGLNLDDLLFKYGVRVSPDLVQDLNCANIPTAFGEMGGKPQIQLVPFPYFPLLGNNGLNHPISKNLDYVMSQFPSSIDTVKAPGITKTPILVTSESSRILSTPAKVEWASVKNQEDMNTFNHGPVPVAYLLEGKFSSLYANRINVALADSLANIYGSPYKASSAEDNQMVVVADGDIVVNPVSQKEGPLTMGRNLYTGYQYANKDFFQNCLEWLTDRSGILELRGKDYTLRLLDKKKIEEERSTWQMLNIGLPILLVLIFALFYQFLRKRRYA